MKIKKALCVSLSLAFILGLNACGGGGSDGSGGGGGGAKLQSAPGNIAFHNYSLSPSSITMTAQDASGNNYILQDSTTPNIGLTPFEDHALAKSFVDTHTLTKNGAVIATATSTEYLDFADYILFGESDSSPDTILFATAYTLPATLNVGDAGILAVGTLGRSPSGTRIDEQSITVTYSVQELDALNLLLCIKDVGSNETTYGLSLGVTPFSQTWCYAVSGSGNVSAASFSYTDASGTLNFRT